MIQDHLSAAKGSGTRRTRAGTEAEEAAAEGKGTRAVRCHGSAKDTLRGKRWAQSSGAADLEQAAPEVGLRARRPCQPMATRCAGPRWPAPHQEGKGGQPMRQQRAPYAGSVARDRRLLPYLFSRLTYPSASTLGIRHQPHAPRLPLVKMADRRRGKAGSGRVWVESAASRAGPSLRRGRSHRPHLGLQCLGRTRWSPASWSLLWRRVRHWSPSQVSNYLGAG